MNKKTALPIRLPTIAMALLGLAAVCAGSVPGYCDGNAASGPPSAASDRLPMYDVKDLGVLPGFVESVATGIARNGDVIGYCDVKPNDRADRQGFLYSGGRMTPVAPLLSPKDWSEPHGINSSHTVVGDFQHGAQIDGFRMENGELQLPQLGEPGSTGSLVKLIQLRPYYIDKPDPVGYHVAIGHINCINEAGTMGGVVEVRTKIHMANGGSAIVVIHRAGIVRAQKGMGASPAAAGSSVHFTFEDLGSLGGRYSDVNAINATGLLAGSADLAQDATGAMFSHACVFDHGKAIDIGTLGGPISEAFGINDRGDVVGDSANARQASRAFLWRSGKMIDLGDIGGGVSEGVAINNQDVVVGRSLTSTFVQHGYVYADGKMRDLNVCIPASLGWLVVDARAINNRGQIAATAVRNGQSHAVVLTPVGGG